MEKTLFETEYIGSKSTMVSNNCDQLSWSKDEDTDTPSAIFFLIYLLKIVIVPIIF